MLDASDKIQTGYLTGNVRHPGNFDECVDIAITKNDTFIRGKHCIYLVSTNITDEALRKQIKKVTFLDGLQKTVLNWGWFFFNHIFFLNNIFLK